MATSIETLNGQHGISGVVHFEAGQGGLACARVSATGGEAVVYLHGAHVTHYAPAGCQPLLWMSKRSWFAPDKPLRGGVPICFPWFGPHARNPQAPSHGFARILPWSVEGTGAEPDGRAWIALVLRDSEMTRDLWPYRFQLRYRVTVGPELSMALETKNLDAEAFTVTEALHTYFGVSDVRNVRVFGLENVDYLDKVDEGARKNQGDAPIAFAGETDRVYLKTTSSTVLDDPAATRLVTVDKRGSRSTVVWNPWTAKAARMEDYGDNEWPGMVCIETANAATDAVIIEPGHTHTIEARISCENVVD